VLSQGMNERLQVHLATRRYFPQQSLRVHVAETRQTRIYNDLAKDTLVAGLFHSTC
jgi:hypothetical protein